MVDYRQIYFDVGCTLDEAINELIDYKKRGQLVYGEFNGVELYSDTVTVDSAYKAVLGMTKQEHYESLLRYKKKMILEEEIYKNSIPDKITEYKEKGRKIIDNVYWDTWDKMVPIRLDDIYRGMDLDSALELVEALNNNCSLNEVKRIFDEQEHSGISSSLVKSMVRDLCDRGKVFYDNVD